MRVAALVTATALALVGGLPQVAAKGKGLRLVLSRQRGALSELVSKEVRDAV